MKISRLLISLLLLPLTLPAIGQEVRFESDTTCGCDIRFVEGIETLRDNGLYGFRRQDGTVIAPCIYKYVADFTGGYCRVWQAAPGYEPTSDSVLLCGVIDSMGNIIVPCLYENTSLPSGNRVRVSKDGLLGYTDLQGAEVIPPRFTRAGDFIEDCAAVYIEMDSQIYATFIDTLGNYIFEPKYQNVLYFQDGYAPVQQHGKWGVVDRRGRQALPFLYDQITAIDHGVFLAGTTEGMALFALPSPFDGFDTLRPLTPFCYLPITGVTERRIGVMREGYYGFIDLRGREVVPCRYDEIGLFRQGRTMAREDDRYGIIDTNGIIILPLQYENKTPKGEKYMYYDSLALVEKEGKLGFVDLDGRVAIPIQFEEAYNFSQGYASVRLKGLWGYIDSRGFPHIPFMFQFASPFKSNRAEVFYRNNLITIALDGRCVKNCNGIKTFKN